MTSGPSLFARFAFPPNELGYCGPSDSSELFEASAAGADRDIGALAPGFAGAWPYLELIADANDIEDPLDTRVVEAYWIGNDLLRVAARHMSRALDDRFRRRAGRHWDAIASAVPAGAVPHHSHHVFGVYPWVGLLRSGRVDEPLRVLERCRIRWGTVLGRDGDRVTVSVRPLVWDGRRLGLGPACNESVTWADGGLSPIVPPRTGDVIAAHWDWVCDVLDTSRLRRLRAWTAHTLRLVNAETPIGAVVG